VTGGHKLAGPLRSRTEVDAERGYGRIKLLREKGGRSKFPLPIEGRPPKKRANEERPVLRKEKRGEFRTGQAPIAQRGRKESEKAPDFLSSPL